MECKLLLTEAGIIILNKNDELLYSKRFPIDQELIYYSDFKTGKTSDLYEQLLIDLNDIDITLLQTDQSNLISLLKSSNVNFEIQYSIIDFTDLISLYIQSNFFSNEIDIKNFLHDFSLQYSKQNIKNISGRDDLQIIEGVNSLDEVDKTVNILIARLTEWYGLHFPELSNLVKDSNNYLQILSLGLERESLNEEHLQNFNFSKNKINAFLKAINESKGGNINQKDLIIISLLAENTLQLVKVRDKIANYVKSNMNRIAPNLSTVAGDTIGARLIAKVGGIEKLARQSSSTIQLLGAEKALFRSLRTGARPPKHGIIFQHDQLHSAPKWQRGKIARALAGKIAIAVRIDAFRGEKANNIESLFHDRLIEIKTKYKEPIIKKYKEPILKLKKKEFNKSNITRIRKKKFRGKKSGKRR